MAGHGQVAEENSGLQGRKSIYSTNMTVDQINEVKNILADLRQKLEIRYEHSSRKHNDAVEKMEVDTDGVDTAKAYAPSSDVSLKLPETPTDDPLYGDSDNFISCNQLYSLSQKNNSRYLIIDVRQKAHYDGSKITFDKCINIPQSEIKPGFAVETVKLKNSKGSIRGAKRPLDVAICFIMEQVKRDAPSKIQKCDSPLTNGPLGHGTPMKRTETSRYAAYQNGTRFTVLPSHITPPSGLKNFIIRNPFEPDLNKLHQSMISPTVFTKNPGSSQQSPGFTWTIDELAHIQPAKIEEFPTQQIYSPDPEVEVKAQAAIDRFFQQNQIIPSPWEIREQKNKSSIPMDTPNRPLELNSTKEVKPRKDVWCQTVLSLPVALPQDVEEVLKPYFTFTQDQSADNDDANSSNNSLRRKLFFNYECTADDDNDSTKSLSPVKMSESMILCHSPPQSAMFVHGTPLKRLPQARRQSTGSSVVKIENLSSPDMSPIRNTKNDMSYKRDELYTCLATRLDSAMDMSIDNIIMEKSSNAINNSNFIAFDENDMQCTEGNQDDRKLILNNSEMNLCDSINMEASKYASSAKNHCDDSPKIITEMGNSMHRNHKQSNAISETLDQQSISNSVQDTGYQTYSTSNMTHTVESYSNISKYRT
ncbi:protein aurora borealis isoform X2 [Ooceraea biroi]|uniref:protein aurora borealis isoform X2 n=1 Tax=Ooceraea biroi TaxID=2015173 RepID=UPI000F08CBC2|nr:protein aurora borealis isoform X2 [Ooceraea biroi]